MSRLLRDVDISISYGDVLASTTIPAGTNMPDGLRAKLHRTIDDLADQINLPPVGSLSALVTPKES